MCTKTSISGLTVEIDPDQPERFTCAWAALPGRAVAFPLLMGQSATPACLADGTAYALGKASPQATARWESLERSMHADKERLTKEVAAHIAAGNPPATQTEVLEQWSRAQAERLVEALRQAD